MPSLGNRVALLAFEQAVRLGNECSAVETLWMNREFPRALHSFKKNGVMFEMTIGRNTPDCVTVKIRPPTPSLMPPAQILFYGTKDGRCYVSAAGGAMRKNL